MDHRRTKIVATIGPASWEVETLAAMIEAGADVMRLNFSHADPDRHARTVEAIREAAEKVGDEVAILGDLPGPKLRVGEFPEGVVELEHGARTTLRTDATIGDAANIPIAWPGLTETLADGDEVYLADGSIRLRVLDVGATTVVCEVEIGGPLSSHKGMNLPGATNGLPAVGAFDMQWVEFGVAHGIDLFAISFVRDATDLEPVKSRLAALGVDTPIIAKIEKPQAATNAEEIIRATDSGIMVARGDLGIELPLSQVPVLQKRLIRLAGRLSRPAITATQMMASMVTSKRPTRAEVADVANAIYDGTDAIMLSEETAMGAHPVEVVAVMDRIARRTETDLPYDEWLHGRTEQSGQDVADAVAQSAVAATSRLNLAALVVPTSSGRTARLVSAHRPRVPVLAVSSRIETVRRLNLLFGVRSVLHDQTGEIRGLLEDCAALAGRHGVARSGDLVGIAAGMPDQDLGTNLFEVHRVP